MVCRAVTNRFSSTTSVLDGFSQRTSGAFVSRSKAFPVSARWRRTATSSGQLSIFCGWPRLMSTQDQVYSDGPLTGSCRRSTVHKSLHGSTEQEDCSSSSARAVGSSFLPRCEEHHSPRVMVLPSGLLSASSFFLSMGFGSWANSFRTGRGS